MAEIPTYEIGSGVIKNLKELTTYWTAKYGFDKMSAPDKQVWKDNTISTIKTIDFYNQWSLYLSDTLPFLHMLNAIPAAIMKFFYTVSSSLEILLSKIFILFGLFDYLNDQSTWLGKFYFWGRFIGIAIFVVLVIARVTLSFLGGSFRYKEFFNNLILISFALNVLPTALVASGNLVGQATKTLMTANGSQNVDSLSLTPIRSNTVDLFRIIDEDFDTDKLKYDPDSKYILKDPADLNDITDKNILYTKFESFVGASTEELLNFYIYKDGDKKEKRTSSDDYYGVATLLTSVKQIGETRKNGSKHYVIAGVEVSSMFGVDFSIFSPVYPRYNINYFTVFIQQIMLIALLVGLLISMIMTIFRVTLSSGVAPFVAYTSVEDSSKFMELLQSIFSGIAGIFFEIAIVQFSMWFLRNAQTVTVGAQTIFNDLGFMSRTLLIIALYIATFLSAIQGSAAISAWLGVSTGSKNGLATALGAGYLAQQGIKHGKNGIFGRRNPITGQRHGGLINNAKTAASFAARAGRTGVDGAKAVGGFAARTAGRVAGGAANVYSGMKNYSASGASIQNAAARTVLDRAGVAGHNALTASKTGLRNAQRNVKRAANNAWNTAKSPIMDGYKQTRNAWTTKKVPPLESNKRVGNTYKVPRDLANQYRENIQSYQPKPSESGMKPVNTTHYKKVGAGTPKNSISDLSLSSGETEEF